VIKCFVFRWRWGARGEVPFASGATVRAHWKASSSGCKRRRPVVVFVASAPRRRAEATRVVKDGMDLLKSPARWRARITCMHACMHALHRIPGWHVRGGRGKTKGRPALSEWCDHTCRCSRTHARTHCPPPAPHTHTPPRRRSRPVRFRRPSLPALFHQIRSLRLC
jgi:hypothetical protein